MGLVSLETLVLLLDLSHVWLYRVANRLRFSSAGDMTKPIYRHLAQQKWLSYDAKLLAQRISQFRVVPDLLPNLEPKASVELWFGDDNYGGTTTVQFLARPL